MRYLFSVPLLWSNHHFATQRSGGLQRMWFWIGLGLASALTSWTANSVQAAERIYVSYGILERSIPVASLEKYARQGIIDDDLAVYARFANNNTNVLTDLKRVLTAKADLGPVAVSQFLYSPQGEVLLKRLGEVIQSESRNSGFSAIRAALILAAADPQGLSLLTVLKRFPTRGIRIDVERSLQIAGDLEQLINQTNRVTQIITQQALAESVTNQPNGPLPAAELRLRGPYGWDRQTITLIDTSRPAVAANAVNQPQVSAAGRTILVDVYQPKAEQRPLSLPLPVVVISHGLGSDRTTFAYLAEHLASHGFAVLVPEHPASNKDQMQALVRGLVNEAADPSEFVDRPRDITFLLDQVANISAFSGRFNLQQVGVLGQSFGGYTALALAGASISFQKLRDACQSLEQTLNLSLLLQCRAAELQQAASSEVQLRDPRIQAAIAINPITSAVFGTEQLQAITIPTMIVTGSADTVAPALPEQIVPFTKLQTPDRYLALMDQGTHFSTIVSLTNNNKANDSDPLPLPPEVIGPSPAIAQRYTNALALAFFKTYIADQPSYRSYLNSTYAESISEAPISLSLIHSLSLSQLNQVVPPEQVTPPPAATPTPALP